MANNEKAISELTTASEIKNSDNLEISQDTGGGLVSLKATILAIANKMLKGINFTSDLQTTDKTVIGAINEVAQGGGGGASTEIIADDFDATSTYAVGDYVVYDGKLYKCTTAVSTAGQWDANDWTETIVMDEVGQGGGGGTGGHTIIDENGTSMTARAGLQFVGADVSDDGTNNKTIVDLASAGGIDGVFVDTDNVIVPETTYSGSLSYTATEDCVAFVNILATSSGSGWVYIDNEVVGRTYFVGTAIINGAYYLLKKGQTLTASSQTYSGIDITYAVYGIQTGTTHSKFQPVIYSLEEREIGVWTDGKPLYEKTIHTGALSTGSNSIAHNITNAGSIIKAFGKFTYSSYENVFPFPSIGSNNWNVSLDEFGTTNIGIAVGSSYTGAYAITDSYTTIQYTKSTDTAGSGSWTPQGVPTHHYSTDEQVIGTWIDGSTLYEKTFVFNSQLVVSNSEWTDTEISNNGISQIIDVRGIDETDKSFWSLNALVGSGNYIQFLAARYNSSAYIRSAIIQYTKSSS